MGSDEDRKRFVTQVLKACRIGQKLRQLGVRPYGVIRIDSATGVEDWAKDPKENTRRIAQTFREACDVAEDFGERLAAEGEICWGGMHSWRKMVGLLELVNRPRTLGFQADMAHTLLYVLGFNAPEDVILSEDWGWNDPAKLDDALRKLTAALRPWTIDFHVAQNDATVKGSGTHDKTGHHCLPTDPNGKLNIPHHAQFWLRNDQGKPTKAFQHICWDGCMFPNETLMKPETWNSILASMIAVRDAHGWSQNGETTKRETRSASVTSRAKRPVRKSAARRPTKARTKAKAKPAKKRTIVRAKAKARRAVKPKSKARSRR